MERARNVARAGARPARELDVPRGATRLVALLGAVLLGVGVLLAIHHEWVRLILDTRPFDFDINLVGAHRLVDGNDLYDRPASHVDAIAFLGSSMRDAFTGPYGSFIGMPAVALVHVPFLLVPHGVAVGAMRVFDVAGVLSSIVLTARVLPVGNRLSGFAVGLGAAVLSVPLVLTLGLGQLHGLTMLGFAVTVWGVARDRPWIAGLGLGVAIAMKLSPVLLLAYLALRGRRRIVVPALGTAVVLCVLAAAVGSPDAVVRWARDVLPDVSGGSHYAYNQSLPAWIERITTSSADFTHQVPLGPLRLLAVVVMLAGVGALWWRTRNRGEVAPLELGAVILVMLVAGPLSWNHYFVWMLVPVVLICDVRLWLGLTTVLRVVVALVGLAALACTADRIHQFRAGEVLADPSLRISGSPYAFGALLLLAVAFVLLWRVPGVVAGGDDQAVRVDTWLRSRREEVTVGG